MKNYHFIPNQLEFNFAAMPLQQKWAEKFNTMPQNGEKIKKHTNGHDEGKSAILAPKIENEEIHDNFAFNDAGGDCFEFALQCQGEMEIENVLIEINKLKI